MKRVFSNRKILYLILGIILVSVFTLTVVYAALSITLNITGSAEVNSAEWGIEISDDILTEEEKNVLLTQGATVVEKNAAGFGDVSLVNAGIISGTTISGLEVSVTKPGDLIMVGFGITNIGSIPMKLESIEMFEPSVVSSINSDADVEWANNNLDFGAGMDRSLEGTVYCPGEGDDLLFYIEVPEDVTTLPGGALTISNIGARINFVQADSSECS